ncbi:hypothetical protein QB953_004477 [Salmonella enterica]|nr:hypothetical protein [Salmonella enterica]
MTMTNDIIATLFRNAPSKVLIPEINKGNPAFSYWSRKLTPGEKLPRGKYFRKEETLRQWTSISLAQSKQITVHVFREETPDD